MTDSVPDVAQPEATAVEAPAQGASMEIHPPHAAPRSFKEFLLQLGTITAGVLIALSLEGMLEWNHYRTLVHEAKEMIGRELADNKREVDSAIGSLPQRKKNLDEAIRLASDILATKTSAIRSVNVGFELPELSSTSWRSAERSGALAHMDYGDVQRYSRVYDFQDIFVARQRQAIQDVSNATIFAGRDPFQADAKDLETFRQLMLAMRGQLVVDEQLAARLSEMYQAALKK
jgi:hypothetical protein